MPDGACVYCKKIVRDDGRPDAETYRRTSLCSRCLTNAHRRRLDITYRPESVEATYHRHVVCPRCGHQHEYDRPPDDGHHTEDCAECGVTFEFEVTTTTTYVAYLPGDAP